MFINAEASALEHQFEHTSPVAPFWTVAIRGNASRQKRFFIIIGAFQLTAAAMEKPGVLCTRPTGATLFDGDILRSVC